MYLIMTLSWNEIKRRAIAFSKEWEDTSNENADAKSFLDAFFNIFGVTRRRVASFEHRIKKLDGHDGYIDMLWKGNLLVEMKSRGKSLDRAYNQAIDYFPGLKEHELPKFILVCDFKSFRLYDLETDRIYDFTLKEFYEKINLFGFIAGYGNNVVYKEQDPVNIEAAELMGRLHDKLKIIGYEGHELEVYLVRLLFCLFADDTTIFNKNTFYDYISGRTSEDGSNFASVINEIFEVLNTTEDKRLKNIPEELAAFPYVNGQLFTENLHLAGFDSTMRDIVLKCCTLDWGKISPAIFGSMFQSVMNPVERRNLGAHYTSETNILKLIKPLFLDELWSEFEKSKNNDNQLKKFHQKIASLKFLDPACGCGNFLVVTYRELRLLELEILKILQKGQRVIDIKQSSLCNVDQFYGIEYNEFPAQIAQVALWLIDHQMNMLFSQEFGEYFVRLPLEKSAMICHTDALEVKWEDVVPKGQLSYILGNPPFGGSKLMSSFQRNQVVREFGGIKGAGVMDYVTAWYIKAAKYIQDTTIKVAFVSTNSIVQGEQVGTLWGLLMNKYGVEIHFAHRTFKWGNEARNKAAVYCVIIGFTVGNTNDKRIFEYEDVKGDAHEVKAKNINSYLVDAPHVIITSRSYPLCNVPEMSFGNMPLDGGYLLLSDEEKTEFLAKEPQAEKYIKPLISAREYLNNEPRWCIWLVDANPSDIRQLPEVKKRVAQVRKLRSGSVRKQTVEKADIPTLFGEIRNFGETYIVVPRVSSENRKYIPMRFFDKNFIVSDTCMAIPNGNLYHFGVLMSTMHMAWINYVCGRLESRFRYSKDIVYNNFPWPKNPTAKQVEAIEKKAKKVLDVRTEFPESSLADLYDPLSMPPALVKAHNELDKAVDIAYRSATFILETNRMEYLFDLYDQYIATLVFKKQLPKKKNNTIPK
ncbi:hypothetical protein EZS27_014691 [termite gut metagenome]|uniref:site-specific DNA-methyltransferase (adenine-specific) n=1 Tax=termite gut metagenome TaxID=433724 RepID=A0A5J4RW73_9ZZZZ